jgi:cellulose synthase/poly-beta-1,6-N-acetylglucosamine synthase-like glycosyltransferase
MRDELTERRRHGLQIRADLAVVIPALNEETLIGRCIGSVMAAGIPANRIFVVDDASTDRTPAVLAAIDDINVLRNAQRRGKAGSVLRLIEHFRIVERFTYVSLLDADSHVAPGYFAAVSRAFDEDPKAVLVCGGPRGMSHNHITAFRTLEYFTSLLTYRKGQDRLGLITVAPGCASTYRTSIVNALDWHGGTLVEDMDLTIQIHRKRLGRVRFETEAIVHTQDPRRFGEYMGQLTRWYSGAWQVMRRHRMPFGGQAIDLEFLVLAGEGLFYSLLVLAAPLVAWLWPHAALRWLMLDQAVSLFTALICAAQLRRFDILMWFPTFVVLRVAGCAVWVRTFWLEIVRQRTLRTWFSVGRYDTDAPAHHARRSLA